MAVAAVAAVAARVRMPTKRAMKRAMVAMVAMVATLEEPTLQLIETRAASTQVGDGGERRELRGGGEGRTQIVAAVRVRVASVWVLAPQGSETRNSKRHQAASRAGGHVKGLRETGPLMWSRC